VRGSHDRHRQAPIGGGAPQAGALRMVAGLTALACALSDDQFVDELKQSRRCGISHWP
jgi:sugar/nucleoside kinase (ribokinase family)